MCDQDPAKHFPFCTFELGQGQKSAYATHAKLHMQLLISAIVQIAGVFRHSLTKNLQQISVESYLRGD